MAESKSMTISSCAELLADKAVARSIRNTWMRDYPPNLALRAKSDAELAAIRKTHPKYVNEMTESQKRESAEIWQEQRRRYELKRASRIADISSKYAEFENAGQWPDGTPFPTPGTRVVNILPGIFGLPQRIEGIVEKKRNGLYQVRVTSGAVGGSRLTPLTPGWTAIATDEFQAMINPGGPLQKIITSFENSEQLYTAIKKLSLEAGGAWIASVMPFSHETWLYQYQSPSRVPDGAYDIAHNKIAWKGKIVPFSRAALYREQQRGYGGDR